MASKYTHQPDVNGTWIDAKGRRYHILGSDESMTRIGTQGYAENGSVGKVLVNPFLDARSRTAYAQIIGLTLDGEAAEASQVSYDDTATAMSLSADTVQQALEHLDAQVDNLKTQAGVGPTNLGVFAGNIISDNNTVRGALEELEAAADDAYVALGIPVGATDFGNAATGTIVPDNATAKAIFDALDDEATDARTLTGTVSGATDLGAFTGVTIPDGQTIKASLQALETALELEIAQENTVIGIAANATDLGTFPGGTVVTDNTTVKGALAELDDDLTDVQTALGLAGGATNLGTFTGDIISDNGTVIGALQELETDLDAIQALAGVLDAATNLGTFTGSVITDNLSIKAALQEIEDELADPTVVTTNFDKVLDNGHPLGPFNTLGKVLDRLDEVEPSSWSRDLTSPVPLKGQMLHDDGLPAGDPAKVATTLPVFLGAGTATDGLAGDVPAPAAGDTAKFLRGTGTWSRPQDVVYGAEVVPTGGAKTGEIAMFYLLQTTNGGTGITLNLPTTMEDPDNPPAIIPIVDGVRIQVADIGGFASSENVTINGSGNNVNGAGAPVVLDQDDFQFELVYDSATSSWYIVTPSTVIAATSALLNTANFRNLATDIGEGVSTAASDVQLAIDDIDDKLRIFVGDDATPTNNKIGLVPKPNTAGGDQGKFLRSDGTWQNSSTVYQSIVANTTALPNTGIVANTTGGPFTLTLPAAPAVGDFVKVADTNGTFDTNPLTIAGNGNNIEGNPNYSARVKYGSYELTWTGSQWVIQQEDAEMVAATTAAAGKAGLVPAPPQDSQNQYLKGDGTFGPATPAWVTGTDYEIGDVVYDPVTRKIFAATAAHTAGATLAGDLANWDGLKGSPADLSGAQTGPVYAATADESVEADTSGAGFTVTLPAAPLAGDRVEIVDITGSFGTNNLTVSGNGNNIEGAATKALSTDYGITELVFNGTEWFAQTESLSVVSRDATTGQYTHIDGDGTSTPIAPFTGASAILDGKVGDVVRPLAGQTGRFLRATGIWDNPQDVVFSALVVDNAGSPWAPDVLTFMLAKTSTGAITIDLPTTMVDTTPLVDGVRMAVADIDGNASANNITINGNGNNVNGAGGPFVINVDDALFEIVWDDVTNSWYVVTPGQVLASTSVFIDGTAWADAGDGRIGIDITGTPFANYASGAITTVKEALDYIDEKIKVFKGSDGVTAGEVGIVPKPVIADDKKFLKGDGTWAVPGLDLTAVKAAGYTAVSGEAVLVDTSGGSFTVALPAAPAAGDRIEIIDTAGALLANPLTINGAGNNVEGSATKVANTNYGVYELIYTGTEWFVQQEGSPVPVMAASTTAAAGAAGLAPAPPADSQNKFLRGDATFGASIPAWATGVDYELGDIVYDAVTDFIYRCSTANTSGATFAGDIANWTELSSGADFAAATTAAAGAKGAVPAPPVDSQNQFLRGDATFGPAVPYFSSGVNYEVGDIVLENVSRAVFRCITAYTGGATLPANIANWETVGALADFTAATTAAAGVNGIVPAPPVDSQNQFLRGDATFGSSIPAWATGVVYELGDVVYDSLTSKIYYASTANTAGATFAGDVANWTELSPAGGVADFTAATTAAPGVNGTVPAPPQDKQNQFLKGDATFGASIPAWATGVNYELGDIVFDALTNKVYRATVVSAPSGATFAGDVANWTELSPSGGVADFTAATTAAPGANGTVPAPPIDSQNQFLKGDATFGSSIPAWVTATVYEVGDVVHDALGKAIYRAKTAHTAGATLAGDLAANWEELSPGAGAIPPTQVESSTDVGAEAGKEQLKMTWPDTTVRYLVRSQTYSAGTQDGIIRLYDADAATLLKTMTKANATGVITIT